MRFEVPQFIEVEDRIFGPLTWRQFLYLGGGIGMAVVLFFYSKLLFLFIGLPLGVLAGALAFFPVNNRPFSFFLEAIFKYLGGQRLYLWRQKTEQLHKQPDVERVTKPNQPSPSEPVITNDKKNIASLARKLELQALQKTE